jgi:hypothetical protein
MHELKEAQVKRQFFLRDAPMGSQPRAQQGPEPLGGVDMDLMETVTVPSRAYSPRLWQTVRWSKPHSGRRWSMSYSSVYTRLPGAMNRSMRGRRVVCRTFSSLRTTTAPPCGIIPKIGVFSFSKVPARAPFNRRRRPSGLFLTASGCPLWPATPYASSHSTSPDPSVPVGEPRSRPAAARSSVVRRPGSSPTLGQFGHWTDSTNPFKVKSIF